MALAMGNVVYMSYKAHYKRVRPSVLRPGLTVPFGPPAHPAFPSGHSFLAHFTALLLLEIEGIRVRFGVSSGAPGDGSKLGKPQWDDLTGNLPVASPLLQIAHRIAVNRERIGVHYPSDTFAGRHLAAGIWDALLHRPVENGNPGVQPIDCPTLNKIIAHAQSEWPTGWV